MSLWRAHSEIYPFPHEQILIQIAFLQSTLVNLISSAFGGKKKFTLEDFFIDYRENYIENAKRVDAEIGNLSIEAQERNAKRMEQLIIAAFSRAGAKINDVTQQTSNHGND